MHAEAAFDTARAVAAIDALLAKLDRSDAPGVVVGVARGDEVIYRRGFGMASLEHAVANTPRTRMRIGSTSKHFACLAALLLAEEGRLDIDAPATRWLPELPRLRGVPSLRQFMHHTSGYRDYVDLITIAAGLTLQPAGIALALQARQSDANFAPGRAQLYCNGGYHLLSIAIERAAGVPFEQVLADRVFAPLGMRDTQSLPSDMQIEAGVATLHVAQPDGRWRRGIFMTEEIKGEGAIVSTVDDMLRWLAHLRGPQRTLGRAATWREMATLATLESGHASNYGLGLFRHDHRGLAVIAHGGNVVGGSCQMLTVPAHGIDVVVLNNGALASPVEQAKKIVEILLEGHRLKGATRRPARKRFAHLLDHRYQSDCGLVIGFGDAGGKLGISVQLSPVVPLLRDEGHRLRLAFDDVALGPIDLPVPQLTDARRAPATLAMLDGGAPRTLTRLPRRAPATRRVGAALVGRYRCDDLAAEAEIAWDGKVLALRLRGDLGSIRMSVQALSERVFSLDVTDARAPMRYVLTRVAQGFRIDSLRTRGLHFRRVGRGGA